MQLAVYMERYEISPAEAARDLNVSTSAVYLWLHAKRMPRPEVLKRIAVWSKGKVTANDFLLVAQNDSLCQAG